MTISAIVAVAHNNVIGKDNQIPWYLPADLSYFKKTTLEHHIVMGRNCFHSIGRPLPKRVNIVVTRDPFFTADGVLVAHSVEEALGMAFDGEEQEVFIIGGGEIYTQTLAHANRLEITHVDIAVDAADAWFPAIDDAFVAAPSPTISNSGISFYFCSYARRGPKFGGWEGKIQMADDFDAELADFSDYMHPIKPQ